MPRTPVTRDLDKQTKVEPKNTTPPVVHKQGTPVAVRRQIDKQRNR
jgi:hypothetical protein